MYLVLLDLVGHPLVQLEELPLGRPASQVNHKGELVHAQHGREDLQGRGGREEGGGRREEGRGGREEEGRGGREEGH